jgi:signal transduction histidine kinase
MNLLIVAWSMVAAICGLLGFIQLLFWSRSQSDRMSLLSAVMSFSAAAVAVTEMTLFVTDDPQRHLALMGWLNVFAAGVIVPAVWVVRGQLPKARLWMAVLVTLLWTLGLLIDVIAPGNITFSELERVVQRETFWGDPFYLPVGTLNPWKWVVDITVLLVPIYVIDAVWRSRNETTRARGVAIAIGVMAFVLFGGIEALLVDLGVLELPYMISVGFLAIVFSLTWVMVQDVIAAQRLERELATAREETEQVMRTNLMGEIAAALAHELNQPLTAILGNAQAAEKMLATDRATDPDELREILADIVRDDKRARDFIQDLRSMLRGDDGDFDRVDLESATREMIALVAGSFERHRVRVRLTVQGQLPAVSGRRVALQQVILNLLLNAERAIHEAHSTRREIHVGLSQSEGGVLLEVRDWGPGLAEEVEDRLFTPFVSTSEHGLGMGLAVSRRIVEGHGGRLTGENAEGGGARFLLWLPGS